MGKQIMKHCAWCGEELGMADSWDRSPESCGKLECSREVRDMYAAERAERQGRAEDDDYERY